MNNKQITLIFSLIALILFSFTACTEPVVIETGKDASFTITINGVGSRSALTWDLSDDNYEISELVHTIILSNGIVPDKVQNNIKAGETASFSVTPGPWDITVWAYLGDEPKAYCFKSVELIPGNNGVINMIMGAPPSDDTPITVAEITITAPTNGGTPATTVSSKAERFTAGTVTWSPDDNPFKPNTEYAATVTLTANSGYTFTGLNTDNAKVNNAVTSISNNTGKTVTLTHSFPATSTKIVSSIMIKSPPTKMEYTHGEELDLTGMIVTLTYDDETPEDVAAINFADKGITPTPAQNTHLERSTHNDNFIKIEYGNFLPIYTTGKLTVNAVNVDVLTIEPVPATTYTGGDIEPAITVKHPVEGSTRTLAEGKDYTLSYSNNKDVGTTATITITGVGDYTGSRDVTFTINKAAGATVDAPTLSSEPSFSDTVIINAVTAPANGQIVEYGISTTNNAATVSKWQEGLILSISDYYGYVNYIFARSKEDSNHLAGEASVSFVTMPFEASFGSSGGNERLPNWLNQQPKNTPATAYLIKVRSSIGFSNIKDQLVKSDRYVIIIDFIDIYTPSTSIGSSDFSNCTTLVGITLPNSIISIGLNAFSGCTSLTDITIPNSVNSIGIQAFYGCSSLTSITIPASVTSIENTTFSGCTSLTSITIPNSVNSIGNNAFYNCTSLTGVTIPASVTSIGNYVFYGCSSLTSVIIPNSVPSIGNYAFYGCTSLTSVTIPASITSIGQQAFYNCTSLTTINVDAGNSTYSSQDGVLYDKAKTTLIQYPARKTDNTFTIPNIITSIGDYAFYGCTSLESIIIPNNVTSIGNGTFASSASLTTINVDAGNSTYSSQDGILYNKDKTVLVAYPAGKTGSTFVIPSGVTSIEDSAFYDCSSLRSITIPDSVTKIGRAAFYRCTSLTSITIPASVNSIGNNAFTYCSSLASVTIGNGVTSIGNTVFSRCTNLTSITFETGSNIPDANFGTTVSPEGSEGAGGNTLKNAYNLASPKEGTYTRAANGSTWGKQ